MRGHQEEKSDLMMDDEFDFSANAEVLTREVMEEYQDPSALGRMVKTVVCTARQSSKQALSYAKANPGTTLLVAGGIGILLGVFAFRKK